MDDEQSKTALQKAARQNIRLLPPNAVFQLDAEHGIVVERRKPRKWLVRRRCLVARKYGLRCAPAPTAFATNGGWTLQKADAIDNFYPNVLVIEHAPRRYLRVELMWAPNAGCIELLVERARSFEIACRAAQAPLIAADAARRLGLKTKGD